MQYQLAKVIQVSLGGEIALGRELWVEAASPSQKMVRSAINGKLLRDKVFNSAYRDPTNGLPFTLAASCLELLPEFKEIFGLLPPEEWMK